MKKQTKRFISALLIALPLVFVLLFFGYFPVHYDVVLYTDNIEGEGICQTFVCPSAGYAAFYKLQFYFGSELKKATLKGFHYDVDRIQLVTSDVTEFDIIGIDTYVKGIHLTHIDPEEILPEGEEVIGNHAKLSSNNGVLHVEVFDPDEGATVSISKPYVPMWFWVAYFTLLILVAVLLAFFLLFLFERFPSVKIPLMGMACIAVTLLAGCFFCGSLPYATYVHFLLNWLLLYAVSLLLGAVTMPFWGTAVTMAFTAFWYVVNYFVIQFRSKPIMPADLKAAGTAAEVMGAYTFIPPLKMVIGFILVVVYGIVLFLLWKGREPKKTAIKIVLFKRGISIVIAVSLMIIGINTDTFKSLNSFAWDAVLMKSFHEEGMVLTFLKSVFNSGVKRPEGYSRELVDNYLSEYEANPTKEDKSSVCPTNIIMVMNEAFADLRTVGLNPNIDVMPFIDSLKDNTIEGSLYVGVFGGGTCNTEFEALTGNTLAFLGTGAYPYTENVTAPLFSLAQYFKDLGYSTDAFHANEAQNWNRNMVYPNLGFDAFHSFKDYEDFGELIMLHDQPADITDYLYIESVEDKNAENPRFLFNVTIQNHSPYERWLDVEKAESVAASGSNLYVDTQVYLSLVKASDDEVHQLVDYYKNSDEPTMIIFFGDHQPGLPGIAMDEIYTDINNYLDFFKSRFFIWTNYDSPELHNAGISANYLPWLILDQGNFPMPPYVRMLEELYEHYPIISSQGVIDIDGNIYTGVAEVMDDPLIQKYQYVQYANLFDEIDPAWFEVQ